MIKAKINSLIVFGCLIVLLVCGFFIFQRKNDNFYINKNTDGTIKVFDAGSKELILTLVEMSEQYTNLEDYESKRIASKNILLDCEAAKPGSFQHCNSIKSATILLDKEYFAAKYSLQGANFNDEGEFPIKYDILDVLFPNGILYSGIIENDISNEDLKTIVDAFN